jgi:hypothetical protein
MTIGSSLLLIATGAILKWAVTAHVTGLNLQNMGLAIGLYLLLRPRWPTGARPGPN